jgi:hypothetical protein
MKNLLLLTLLLFGINSYGQTNLKIGDIIRFKTDVTHSLTSEYKKNLKTDLTVDINNTNPILLKPDCKFRIVDISASGYKITALLFEPLKNKEKGKNMKIDNSELYNYKLFEVSKDEFELKAELIPEDDRISIGILTLPFKFRPQDSKSFDTDFNLNSILNIKLWNSNNYAQLGAGIGGVDLNSTNSKGIDADENIKASCLSFFIGLMKQYKKVQAGIYIGVDHINNQKHYQWDNNGNLWVSVGIGYQLFDVTLGQNNKNKQN